MRRRVFVSESLFVHRISNAIRSKQSLVRACERNVVRIENLDAFLGDDGNFGLGFRFLWNMGICCNVGYSSDDVFVVFVSLKN